MRQRNKRAKLIFRSWNAHRRGETRLLLLNGELPKVER